MLPAFAQLPYHLVGARLAGMGGAAVPVADHWAALYNIGALAHTERASLSVGYQTRFNLPELSTAALAANVPLPIGVAGVSFSRYGFGPHHVTEVSLGLARKLQLVALGLQLGVVQTATQGFGSSTLPLLNLGGTAQLLPELRFGASIYNMLQSRLSKEIGEHLPTLLKAGLQWQASESLLLVVETEKDVDFPAAFKTGLEYKLRPFLALRTGISTNALSLHAGIGFSQKELSIDYALQHHEHLGLMHHVSVGFSLSKLK